MNILGFQTNKKTKNVPFSKQKKKQREQKRAKNTRKKQEIREIRENHDSPAKNHVKRKHA